MTRPGTTTDLLRTPPPRGNPTATGTRFVADFAERGPITAQLFTSLDAFVAAAGGRVSYSFAYDVAETHFREGGTTLYFARVVGPTPVKATKNLMDGAGSPAVSLIVKAKSYGAYGNSITVAVAAGSTSGYKLTVTDGVTTEVADNLATQQAAVDWSATSELVAITVGVSALVPANAAAAALTSGTDDHTNATDAHFKAALDVFSKDLGPGQVSCPGRTTTQGHTDLLTHGYERNRRALLDGADTSSKGTLKAATAALASLVHQDGTPLGQFGILLAPWGQIPPVLPGASPRTIPYSAIEGGIIARNDGNGISVNQPSAGEQYGVSRYAVGLSQPPWSDADREELNAAGVSVARLINGAVETYGYRTLVDPDDPNWLLFSNSRLLMEIQAKAEVILGRFVFRKIDGQGHTTSELGGALVGMLTPYWEVGDLYGATIEEAFNVDTGPSINTAERIANNELHAFMALRMSPMAELVPLHISKVRTQEAVA